MAERSTPQKKKKKKRSTNRNRHGAAVRKRRFQVLRKTLKGRRHLNARLVNQSITWPIVKHYRGEGKVAITDGVGVYLSSLPDVVPQALEAQIRVTHSMPKQIVVVKNWRGSAVKKRHVLLRKSAAKSLRKR